jgi:hypothetical protein
VTGLNILKDGGLEQQLALTGGGPNGDEVPAIRTHTGDPGPPGYYNGEDLWWPSDDSVAPSHVGAIASTQYFNTTGVNNPPSISLVNPQSGSHHLRTYYLPRASGGDLKPPGFIFWNFHACPPHGEPGTSTGIPWKTAVVDPGDYAEIGISAVISNNYVADQFYLTMWLEYHDGDHEWLGPSDDWPDTLARPTNSYQSWSNGLFVPATIGGGVPHYAVLWLLFAQVAAHGDQSLMTVDLDDCQLEVS